MELPGQVLENLTELIELEKSLPDVVLGQQGDVRHRCDQAMTQAQPVHSLQRGELSVQRCRGGALLQPQALVSLDRSGRNVDGLRPGEHIREPRETDLFKWARLFRPLLR